MTLISLGESIPLIRSVSNNEPSRQHIEMMINQLIKGLELEGEIERKKFKQHGKLKIYTYNISDNVAMVMVERLDIIEYPKL